MSTCKILSNVQLQDNTRHNLAHEYYPFALEDGGWLAPMATHLVESLAVLVAVVASLAWVLGALAHCVLIIIMSA
jgi:hypothetical protein